MSRHPIVPDEKACVVCGTVFLVGGRGRPRWKKACSRTCANLARYRRTTKFPHQLSEVDSAYLAGLIDGEGSVMLTARSGGGQLKVSIWMTHRGVLDWVHTKTGVGGVWTHERPPNKTVYGWACSGEAAEALLRQLLSYLIVKQDQAQLALAFQERIRQPALKADRTWQVEWRAQMRALSPHGAV